MDLAFRAFFRRVQNGETPGYSRFKSRARYDSFTYPQEKGNWRFVETGRLRLSKIGEVKIELYRPLEGECKTLTMRRDGVGNRYACFSCIVAPKRLPPVERVRRQCRFEHTRTRAGVRRVRPVEAPGLIRESSHRIFPRA